MIPACIIAQSAAILCTPQVGQEQIELARELVVEWVIEPPLSKGADFSRWVSVDPYGDPDRDGRMNALLRGIAWGTGPSGTAEREVVWHATLPDTLGSEGVLATHPIDKDLRFFGTPEDTGGILRGANGNAFLVGRSYRASPFSPQLFTFDIAASNGPRDVVLPTIPGVSDLQARELLPIPDVNQDGWDDLVVAAIGVVSGQSVLVGLTMSGSDSSCLWSFVERDFSRLLPSFSRTHSSEEADFDRDGFSDCLFGYVTQSGSFVYSARSGFDGQEIWQAEDFPSFTPTYRTTYSGKDLNEDGIADVVTTFRSIPFSGATDAGWTSALDGATGSEIWRTRNEDLIAEFAKGLPPLATVAWGTHELLVTPSLHPGADLEVWIYVNYLEASFVESAQAVLCMNARTGKPTGRMEFPSTLEPWRRMEVQHPLNRFSWEVPHAIGDIDGDGHGETAYIAATEPGALDSDSVLVVFGHRSLSMPMEADPGDQIPGHLFLPGQPQGRWQLLCSSEFDPNHGLRLGGWSTDLGLSPVLSASRATGPRGQLNYEGAASFSTSVPASPSLRGKNLYCRAIIGQPIQPDRVASVSSLSMIRIR